ncbi:hypothetical protein [Kamptonema formosum]|uniref:hypothetical protein n=1 Tax=Kamptonema formosum TaxID=331992 RepID=UPI00034D6CD6|nr:hypothetical protein [Oscillatoria sp. PCC 10802]
MVNALGRHRAIGVFPTREATEAALTQLKNYDFPMEKVSVVAREVSEGDELARTPEKFIQDKSIEGLGKGIVAGGSLGGIAGLLAAGLTAVAVPGLGSVALAGAAGMFAGGYYGAAGGGIIGAILGNGVSKEQTRLYSEHLSEGHYLVTVEGTDEEIRQAESILTGQGVQDWGVYSTA